jgi:hypothetical protein
VKTYLLKLINKTTKTHIQCIESSTINNNGFRSGYSCETQSAVTIDDLVRYDEKLQTDIAIFQRPLIQCHTINSYINLSLVAYKAFYISELKSFYVTEK